MRAPLWISTIALTISMFSCSKAPKKASAPSLLPSNASIVLRINDLSSVAAVADTSGIELLKSLPIDALQQLSSAPWAGALAPSGASKMDWVWTSEAQTPLPTTSETSYNGKSIFRIDSLYAYKANGAWAISYNQGLIQDVINQEALGYSLMDHAEFAKLWNNASSSDAMNLLVNHDEIAPVGQLFFEQDWSWIKHLATWTEIDIAFRPNKTMLTSVSIAADSTSQFLSTFKGRASGAPLSHMIANSASYALTMRTGDLVPWLREFNSYRGKKQRLKQAQNLLEQAEIDPLTSALDFSGNFLRMGYGNGTLVVCELTDDHHMASTLGKLSADTKILQGHQSGALKEQHKFLFSSLFGWYFTDLNTPTWIVYEDYLVLASDPTLLDIYLSEKALRKVWGATPSFDALASAIDERDHFAIALPLSSLTDQLGFGSTLPAHLERSYFTGTLDAKDEMAFGAGTIKTAKEDAPVSAYMWSTALNANAAAGPWLVQNHRTNAQNIVVQDDNHTLYQLDHEGQILWQKDLDGPLVGELEQVDLYKNNKFQLICTTSEQLHCIDLLGRNVEGFPVKLPQSTTVGLSVIDYDKNRNYRFLVAAGDQIYNYSAEGKLVQGWKTDAAGAAITQRPVLYQRGGKDYIYTSTAEKALILNRRGEPRIKTTALSPSDANWILLPENVPAIVRPSANGNLQYQRWDESTDEISDPIGTVRGLDYQSYGLIVWSSDELEVRDQSGTKRFDFDGITDLHTFPGGTGLVLLENGTVEVVLLSSGEQLNTFQGSNATAGRLTTTSAPVIVLVDGKNVVSYEL